MQNITADPSSQVQPELRPHLHLISSFKCESRGDPFSFSNEQIVELLKMAAVETKSNDESWCWKMLEAPRDRSALMIWQSPQQGRNFPSDGYVWADQEEPKVEQIQGFKLECMRHRSGYVPSYEQYTLHARTRYRLLSGNSNQTTQSCDPHLWLVLYQKAVKSRIMHTKNISMDNIQHQRPIIEQRRMILHNGAPKSKDFVWEDRSHWPEIRIPPNPGPSRTFGPNMIARSQQAPYMAGQQLIDPRTGQPTAKRLKQAAVAPGYSYPDGEDDGGSGDVMDLLTPRDISRARYRQHAEWMEELYASPFAIGNIKPVNIGLGRQGELASLSANIASIDTPMGLEDGTLTRKISSSDFEQYVQNAQEKMAELRMSMEREKELHGKRLARLQQNSNIRDAEKKLRSAIQLPSVASQSSNSHRSEKDGPDRAPLQRDAEAAAVRQVDDIEKIAKTVENSLNRRIELLELTKMVERGGLEERPPSPINLDQSDGQNEAHDQNKESAQHVTPIGEFVAVDTPTQSFSQQTSGEPNGSRVDEDYVMVDKATPADVEAQDEPTIEQEENVAEDAIAGGDFLDFESDGNVDNFDSMFTDAIDAGAGLETPDENAMQGLESALENQEDTTSRNTIDTLTG